MEKDEPPRRGTLRDNKHVFVGGLVIVTLLLFGVLVYAVFVEPDVAPPRDAQGSTAPGPGRPAAAPAPR